MYIKTSSKNHGNDKFISFERIDILQIFKIAFYYIRFTILTIGSVHGVDLEFNC